MAKAEAGAARKFKVAPKVVPSDDCAVAVGGETIYPHAGERVEIVPFATVGQMIDTLALSRQGLGGQLTEDMVAADPELRAAIERSFSGACEQLARIVTGWDWTDLAGEPLPAPYRNPDAFRALSVDELQYLMGLAQGGESAESRKNGSAPSADGS